MPETFSLKGVESSRMLPGSCDAQQAGAGFQDWEETLALADSLPQLLRTVMTDTTVGLKEVVF